MGLARRQGHHLGGCVNVRPVTLREAQAFVGRIHRHHAPPRGARAALGLYRATELVGVATLARPVARLIPWRSIAEVTRVAVADDTKHGCSMLYGAAARVAQAWGFYAVMTYTLAGESGASLRGAGWWPEPVRDSGSWNRPGRGRDQAKGDDLGLKVRWVRFLREWDESFDAVPQLDLLEVANG